MSRIFSSRTIFHKKTRSNLQTKHKMMKKATKRDDLKAKCRRLKEEMEDIRKEQTSIKEAQSQVGEKLKGIEKECEALQEETKLMIQQSAFTQLRLSLMFNIIKARKDGDLANAARITQLLRDVIARDKMKQET